MTTLRELLGLTWNVTLLSLDLRDGDMGRLIRTYKIGENENEDTCTVHEYHRVKSGELQLIDAKVNHHGDPVGKGQSEGGWGTNFKNIPKELLDCAVSSFSIANYSDGDRLSAHIYRTQQTIFDTLEGGQP